MNSKPYTDQSDDSASQDSSVKVPNSIELTKLSEEEELNPKKLLLQTLGTLVALGVILTIISTRFKEPVEAWSRQFIELTGHWGVGLGFLLPDAFTLPIPPDAFLMAGYMGGLDFLTVAISASVGSILGGTLGFLMIRKLSSSPMIQRRLNKKLKWGERFMSRYGAIALGLAALTPLPYSIICWACGATHMRLSLFLTVSLLRVPRVFAYLWFIEKTLSLT